MQRSAASHKAGTLQRHHEHQNPSAPCLCRHCRLLHPLLGLLRLELLAQERLLPSQPLLLGGVLVPLPAFTFSAPRAAAVAVSTKHHKQASLNPCTPA